MSITDIVQSSGWKNFMSKLYGIGAAVVIIGAMFKIMHWPFAGLMIVIGLSTEAIIFFFSAFEPPHEELDWTLVYPELAGMTDPDDLEEYREDSISGRGVGLQKFDELFQEASISPETIKNLSTGLSSLSSNTKNLADITAATVATKEYFTSMKSASESLNTITSSYAQQSGELTESVSGLASSYKKSAEIIDKSGQDIANKFNQSSALLVNSYEEVSKNVKNDYTNISQGNKLFSEQLNNLNKNLNVLNSSYEAQVKDSQNYLKGTQNLYTGLDEMVKNLKGSVDETQKYKDEISKLSRNLSELNNIYGSMLSAMSVINKK
jgi:gliding motility-associated protein GldL